MFIIQLFMTLHIVSNEHFVQLANINLIMNLYIKIKQGTLHQIS